MRQFVPSTPTANFASNDVQILEHIHGGVRQTSRFLFPSKNSATCPGGSDEVAFEPTPILFSGTPVRSAVWTIQRS